MSAQQSDAVAPCASVQRTQAAVVAAVAVMFAVAAAVDVAVRVTLWFCFLEAVEGPAATPFAVVVVAAAAFVPPAVVLLALGDSCPRSQESVYFLQFRSSKSCKNYGNLTTQISIFGASVTSD